MLEVLLHPTARKELGRVPKDDHNRILEQLAALGKCKYPLEHRRVIKLSGRTTNDYRLRVGDWRVKFTLQDAVVYVTEVENRQAGY